MPRDREFSDDILALPFHEFDLIFGMYWLSKHQAIVDWDKKIVRLKCSDLLEVTIHGIQSRALSNINSAMQGRRLLRKGCKAFFALEFDSKRGQIDVEKIPLVNEFLDVFPEELPGIRPEREIDMSIEV